jgi:glycerophosphoryl diester phosphodiesterase
MIIGHRGGLPFGPDNTMKAFKLAVACKIEGIEFDVWLSKDDVPMITHGGNNGQLEKYGLP